MSAHTKSSWAGIKIGSVSNVRGTEEKASSSLPSWRLGRELPTSSLFDV